MWGLWGLGSVFPCITGISWSTVAKFGGKISFLGGSLETPFGNLGTVAIQRKFDKTDSYIATVNNNTTTLAAQKRYTKCARQIQLRDACCYLANTAEVQCRLLPSYFGRCFFILRSDASRLYIGSS